MTTNEAIVKLDKLIPAVVEAEKSTIPEIKQTGEEMKKQVVKLIYNNLNKLAAIHNISTGGPMIYDLDSICVSAVEAPLKKYADTISGHQFPLVCGYMPQPAIPFFFGLCGDSGIKRVSVFCSTGQFITLPISDFITEWCPIETDEHSQQFASTATVLIQTIRSTGSINQDTLEFLEKRVFETAVGASVFVPVRKGEATDDNNGLLTIPSLQWKNAVDDDAKNYILTPAFTSVKAITTYPDEDVYSQWTSEVKIGLVDLLHRILESQKPDEPARMVVLNPGSQNWIIATDFARKIVDYYQEVKKMNGKDDQNNVQQKE